MGGLPDLVLIWDEAQVIIIVIHRHEGLPWRPAISRPARGPCSSRPRGPWTLWGLQLLLLFLLLHYLSIAHVGEACRRARIGAAPFIHIVDALWADAEACGILYTNFMQEA